MSSDPPAVPPVSAPVADASAVDASASSASAVSASPSTAGPSTGSWAHHTTGDAGGSFPDMDVDADLDRVSVIESLCMWCHKQGITRLLLTRIPYFRDIVVMSFECGHCHARSAEVQPANELAEKAARVTLRVDPLADPQAARLDLNRQLIKSETCRVLVPELDFEIPPNEKRGDINTVEGVLSNIADSLEVGQPNREIAEPETAAKIQSIIEHFRAYAAGEKPFTLILDDLAGNSYLENPAAPASDPRVQTKYYERTAEQTISLGYAVEENKNEIEQREVLRGEEAKQKLQELMEARAAAKAAASGDADKVHHPAATRGVSVAAASLASLDTYFNVSDRSATMRGICNACTRECETRMCVTEVPHFKDVVLLVTQCDSCGYRDAEVKPMGRISDKGRRITLRVTSADDLKRDLLKSETASVSIPELELELLPGTLGGKYTTLEGMVDDIRAQLERVQPFARGDSSEAKQREAMASFMERLTALPSVEQPWTFVLDDPLGNVFIWSALGAEDPQMTVEQYERSFDQNEELGLNDINVDEYMTAEQKREMDEELDREAKEKEDARASLRADGEADKHLEYHEKSKEQREKEKAEHVADLKHTKLGGLIKPEELTEDDQNKPASAAAASTFK